MLEQGGDREGLQGFGLNDLFLLSLFREVQFLPSVFSVILVRSGLVSISFLCYQNFFLKQIKNHC